MATYLQRYIHPVRTLAYVLLICTPVLSASALLSETVQVRIEGDSAAGALTVHVENANLEEVLTHLALKFGFEFNAASKKNSDNQWSATLAASNLETLLQRLLRNRNHSIIRSDGARGPIRKILLLERRPGLNLAPVPGRLRGNRTKRKAAKHSTRPADARIKPENRKRP